MNQDSLCPNCNHPESDHEGYWSDGELIPGKLCFHMENQGYDQDLCPCPGFDARPGDNQALESYVGTLLGKAGAM